MVRTEDLPRTDRKFLCSERHGGRRASVSSKVRMTRTSRPLAAAFRDQTIMTADVGSASWNTKPLHAATHWFRELRFVFNERQVLSHDGDLKLVCIPCAQEWTHNIHRGVRKFWRCNENPKATADRENQEQIAWGPFPTLIPVDTADRSAAPATSTPSSSW